MADRFKPPSAEAVAAVRALAERRLSAEEFNAYVDAPLSDFEREEIAANIEWFKRRYPTPAARLRWASRTWAQWSRHQP
jgi:hypothetical protein